MHKQQGFTLIELLVVIAIIAVLMAILMPALRRVKEQGNMIKCLANLRQWNLIIAMYVEDNDGKFFSGYGNNSYWWIAQLEDRYESRLKNPLWFCPKSTKPLFDEYHNRSERFNIFSAWGIFTRDFDGVQELCRDGVSGSYGLNSYVLSTQAPPGHTFENGIRSDTFWKTPQVKGASNIPLFIEALRFDVWPQENEGPAQYEDAAWAGNHMGRCCINRHVGFENASFCDFSARKVGLKELWTFKWHREFNTGGSWTKAGRVQASDWPEWIRRFKDY
ncbi:MAG: type II secretion system protein [Planctomycetota bacterium]|jgi:prepilin-type N-terminal cleavage/methylation domain-containing protein